MSVVALNTYKMSASDLIIFARNVQLKMTASATLYPNPPVDIVDFGSYIDDLETAQLATLSGGGDSIVIRDQKKVIVVDALKKLAFYVNIQSNGIEANINLAGMTTKTRGPRRYDSLATPDNIMTSSVNSGKVDLRWKPIHNAKTYAVEHCPDPLTGTQWVNGMYNSAANASLEGLDPGKTYWFRVRALGSEGMTSDWSDPVCRMAM